MRKTCSTSIEEGLRHIHQMLLILEKLIIETIGYKSWLRELKGWIERGRESGAGD